jgi:hypothetical protein
MEVTKQQVVSIQQPPLTEISAEVAAEAEDDVAATIEIPEPDFESYAHVPISDLEAEIESLSHDHFKNLGEIGPRVFWLNEKYKTPKKRKGTGAKAYCAKIGFDLNHWNYLVRVFTPQDMKKDRLAQKAAKKQCKHIPEAVTQPPCSEMDQVVDELDPKIKNSINSFEEVRALVKKLLAGLSPAKQKKELTDLREWIIGQLMDLEEEIKSQQAA